MLRNNKNYYEYTKKFHFKQTLFPNTAKKPQSIKRSNGNHYSTSEIFYKDKELKIDAGTLLIKVIEPLSIPLGCKTGICYMCNIDVLEGEKNLSKQTEQELFRTESKKKQLTCQCSIEKSTVCINF